MTAIERQQAARKAIALLTEAQQTLGRIPDDDEDGHLLGYAQDGIDSAFDYLRTYVKRWGER